MKTRSVASLAVLLSLGMLAVVTLIKDDNGISEESEDRSMLQYDNEIAEESDDNTPGFRMRRKRVKALADRLKLDDWRKLTTLAKYIENEGWKEQCSESDEPCVAIFVSFTVSDEPRSTETNDEIVYESWHQEDLFRLSLKEAGETKTVLFKPENPRLKSENKFTIDFQSENMMKLRVDWVFSYLWDPDQKKESYFVGVMSNDGYKCYSKTGVNECYSNRIFSVAEADFGRSYSGPWMAFDNAVLIYEDKLGKRVNALVNRLKLDDTRRLPTLATFIDNEGWKQECSNSDEKCVVIFVSFSVSDEAEYQTSDEIMYTSVFQYDSFRLSLKELGRHKTMLFKPQNPFLWGEILFGIQFDSQSTMKMRVDWVFTYLWDADKKQELFFVGVMSNDGYKCYSKNEEGCEYRRSFKVGDQTRRIHPDAWKAFDNAEVIYEEKI